MIYDTLQNASLYCGVSKNLGKALAYLKAVDISSLPTGKHEVDGENVFLTVQEPALKPYHNTVWEAHRKYIDIQIAFADGETVAYAPLQDIDGWGDYNSSADFQTSQSTVQGLLLPLKAKMFAVFFPNDAHRPLIGNGSTRKAVIKVLAE